MLSEESAVILKRYLASGWGTWASFFFFCSLVFVVYAVFEKKLLFVPDCTQMYRVCIPTRSSVDEQATWKHKWKRTGKQRLTR